jgi:hypothetical protein
MVDTNVVLDDILGRVPNSENTRKISPADFLVQFGYTFTMEKEGK